MKGVFKYGFKRSKSYKTNDDERNDKLSADIIDIIAGTLLKKDVDIYIKRKLIGTIATNNIQQQSHDIKSSIELRTRNNNKAYLYFYLHGTDLLGEILLSKKVYIIIQPNQYILAIYSNLQSIFLIFKRSLHEWLQLFTLYHCNIYITDNITNFFYQQDKFFITKWNETLLLDLIQLQANFTIQIGDDTFNSTLCLCYLICKNDVLCIICQVNHCFIFIPLYQYHIQQQDQPQSDQAAQEFYFILSLTTKHQDHHSSYIKFSTLNKDILQQWLDKLYETKHKANKHQVNESIDLNELKESEKNYHQIQMKLQKFINSSVNKSIKEGFLRKQGGNIKTIKTRYFILNKDSLSYYRNKYDSSSYQCIIISWLCSKH